MTHPLKNDMTDGGGRLNFGEGRGFPSTTDKQLISHDYLVELYLGLDQAEFVMSSSHKQYIYVGIYTKLYVHKFESDFL